MRLILLGPASALWLTLVGVVFAISSKAAADAQVQTSAVGLSAERVEPGNAIQLRGVIEASPAARLVDVLFRISDLHGDTVVEAPIGRVALGADKSTSVAERFTLSKVQAPGRYEASIFVRAPDSEAILAAAKPAFFVVSPPPAGPPRIAFVIPSTERSGEFITLAGDNFEGATKVMFGAVPATDFTLISPTAIKVRVPNAATAAAVSVAAARGTGVSPLAFRPMSPSPVKGLTLAWHDEFDGDKLDASRWNTGTFLRHRDAINTSEAVRVHDGKLTISTFSRDGQNYTGYLDTSGKYAARFGYIEARIKFHDSPGEWSAFWMLNWHNDGKILNNAAVSGNEVDIAEHRFVDAHAAHSTADDYDCGLAYNGYGGDTVGTDKFPLPLGGGAKIQDEWHVYGMLWKDTGYTFYFDGRPQWSFVTPAGVSQIGEFLLLTSEVQDHFWAGDIPRSGFGGADVSATQMDVDWVRVWQ